jgi:hypothetical protein
MRTQVLVLGTALLACPAAAQWNTATDYTGTSPRNTATVRNENGAQVDLWLDEDARLRLVFSLPRGLVALAPDLCPTFQVDDRPSEDLSGPEHACSARGGEATLTLAQAREQQVRSATLLELMNGSSLTVRYRLEHAGYGAAEFTLKRSKQALYDVLGEGYEVGAD